MAIITLATLRDYWKNVSDWVTGVSTSEPNVKLTGRKVRLTPINANSTTTINASSSEVVTIQATPGYIAKFVTLFINIPAVSGATSGTHLIRLKLDTYNQVLQVTAAYNQPIIVQRFELTSTATDRKPATDDLLGGNFAKLRFTNEIPIILDYVNNTDAAQSSTRVILFYIEEEAII